MTSERETILKLRADAIERGDIDLAIVYGWSAIRMGAQELPEPERSIYEGMARAGAALSFNVKRLSNEK